MFNPTNAQDHGGRENEPTIKPDAAEPYRASHGSLTSEQRAAYRDSLTMPHWREYDRIADEEQGWFIYTQPPYSELQQIDLTPAVPRESIPPSDNAPLIFPHGTLFYGPITAPGYSDAAAALKVS
jgi:hypothetical protein